MVDGCLGRRRVAGSKAQEQELGEGSGLLARRAAIDGWPVARSGRGDGRGMNGREATRRGSIHGL